MPPPSDPAGLDATPPDAPTIAHGVTGTVTDVETGTPLAGVVVEVVGGEGSAITDDDGRYRLALPRGTYVLRVRGELYQLRRIRNVTVRGGLATVDVKLHLDELAIEEVVVEAEPDRKSEAANLAERKRSAVVQDAVSA